MKKHLLFLFTALTLLLVPAALRAQTTVTIGDVSSGLSSYTVPVNMYYNYSLTQQIYTADEINMPGGGTITSISFEYTTSDTFSLDEISIYMKNVSKSNFTSNTDMVEVTANDRVYSNTVSAPGAGWVTLTLNTPFHYDGTSNLLICFFDHTDGYPGQSHQFRCTSTQNDYPGQYLTSTYYSDTDIPNLNDINSFSSNKALQTFRNNIRMTIYPDISDIYITGFLAPIWGGHPNFILSTPLSEPYSIQTNYCHWKDVTNTPANIFDTYVFDEEGHDYTMEIYIRADNNYHFANNATVYIDGGTELVKAQYLDGGFYVAQTIPFHMTRGNNVAIGHESNNHYTSPYNSLYEYSFVEQVYTAAELGTPSGGEISCIRFNMQSTDEQTNHITVYMKNVSQSEFSSTSDYETVTADDIVYEGDYTFANGWNSIPLTTPFHYNGTDNLMIAIHENTPGYEPRYFYYTEKSNSVLSFHNDNSDPDPYNLASWTNYINLTNKRANIEIDIHPSATVNNGTVANGFVPVYGYYADAYLKAEFVTPAASLTSIPNNSEITSMTFYAATPPSGSWEPASFKVFMKEVASTMLSDFTGYDDAVVVYEGALSVVNDKMTISFTTPYTYHGGNLLIGVYNMVTGQWSTCSWLGVTAEGASVSDYSYNSLDNVNDATQQDFLPKTTFTFTTSPSPLVQIGNGTDTHYALPTDVYYNFSLTEQIYTASEIGRSGDIYTLAFRNNGNAVTRDLDIYMVNTNKSSFSDGTDWVAVSSSDLVFSGELEFLSNEWTTIELTNPFHHSSTDNLLIVVDDNTGGYVDVVPFSAFDATSQALTIFHDEIDFDPFAPETYSGDVEYQKNQIQLGFEPPACPKPTNFSASNITSNSVDLEWTGSGDAYSVKYRPSSVVFFDDFESGLGQWTLIDADNDGFVWGLGSELISNEFTPLSGSDIACSQSYDTEEGGLYPDNYLVTPQVTLGGTVSFWAKAQHPDYPNEHFGIAVSTTGNTYASDFMTIDEWTLAAGDWQQFTVDLSGYAGETGYVALRHFNCYDEYLLDIDDFTIYGPEEPWQTATTTTANIQLNGLTPETTYEVQVQSNCGSDGVSNWSDLLTFTTSTYYQINSSADWYAYAWHSSDPESWEEQFISFSMQDPSNATAATSSPTPKIFAATYADGYMWYLTFPNGDLGKAIVDNENHTISNFETITSSYESNTAVAISYNPVDGRMYYLDGYSTLKSFNPAQPNDVTVIGQTSILQNNLEEPVIIFTLAINSAGEAYGVDYNTSNLYHINLTDASISLVGPTGHHYEFSQGMAFDLMTGELFWAQYNGPYDNALYLVNSSTAETYYLGHLGGGNGGSFTCMFMVGNSMPSCPAPTNLMVSNITSNSAELSWTNLSSVIEWQICVDDNEDNLITVSTNAYTLTDLLPETSHSVKVRANCGSNGESTWSSVMIFNTIPEIQSTANWYAYAVSSSDGESWAGHYINFPIQNPSTVTTASSNTIPITFAAAYANGYMWYIDYSDGHLGKAVVDNANHTISNFETIVSGFESDETTTMSYNPVDGKMYYIDINSKLKSFDPAQPNVFTEVGTFSQAIVSLAINNEGEAYGVEFQTGNLYHVDLTNASTILVGSTGHDYDYPLDLAFDMETGELFWAQYSSALDNALYWVNPGTAQAYNIGRIGGGNGGMFAGLFMVGNSTPSCTVPTDLEAGNISKHTAELSWTENGSATEWQIMVNHEEGDIINVYGNPYILENLNAYTEYTVQVRANCGSGFVSDWSDEVHFITQVGCQASNDLHVENYSYNTATLTWSGEGQSFNVEYSLLGSGTWETAENIMPPYTLTNLIPGSNYEVHVIGNCGTDGFSDWSNTVTFSTPTCPIPSGLFAYNITKHTAKLSWTENGSATEWQISLAHGSDIDIITVTGTPSYTLTNLDAYTEYTVMVQSNCDGSWSGWGVEGSFITQVGCQASNNLLVESFSYNTATLTWTGEGETFNLRYRTPGNEWVMTNNVVSPYELTNLQSNTDYEVQVQNNCGTDGLSDWSNLATFTTSLCPAPSGLEASNITKHTADLSWTENGSASEWQILVTSGEVNTFTVTDNPYTLTGLAPYTEYTVQVRANCGGTWSDWSNEEHFITPIGCPATNDLDVIQTSYYFGMISWTGEGETFNVRYRVAGGEWDTVENVVSFYKINGLTPGTDYEAQVQNNCGTDGLSDWSNLVTFTTLICPTPTGLTVTNVTNNSAVISWTENGTATVWQLHIDNHYIGMLDVYENPYTLTGLNAGAEYTVQVVAYCGAVLSDLSEELTFTTDIACHATGDLHVTAVTPNSATLDWTGEGDAFEMQYKTGDGEWVLENNVTPPYTLTGLVPNTYYEVQVRSICTGYGVSEWSNTATFATSLCPAPTSLTISNITKNSAVLSWTETGTATAWKISIDNHYMNLFDVNENPYTITGLSAGTEYTVKVSAICGASWSDWSNEVTFTTEVACLPTEDLAVTDYTYNTATLNWTGEGNVFHIRHRVPGGEWVATDGIVPPYTLTDLNPGTTYEAQVKNECAGGNQSEWSNLVTFTTSACDPQAIPYAYNFETEEPFYCWRHVTGDVELIQALPSHNHTPNGQYSMAFYESASDVIAFPQFTQEVNTLQVSFWVRPHNSTFSGNGTFAVGYLTDVNDASTFTAVSTYNYNDWPASMDFLRKIVTLQDAPAGAVIAFRHDSPTENGTWYMDDIVVSAICDVPTGIAVSNITNQSATVTWTDNGAAAWTLALNSMENYVPNITTNQYTFTGLTPGMTYSVKVRSRCGDDILSNWSDQVIFTTLNNSIPTYATITGDSTVCHLSTTILTANTDVPATYLWSNGATTKQINVGAGTYQVTVTSATGNELVSEPFTLTEKQTFATDDSRSICPSELPYTWNGHTFQETGMAFVTLTASNGCDSIVTMVLTVNPTYSVTEERTVCPNALPYTWNGISFSGPAMKYVTLPTVNGCDSMVTMVLSVSDAYEMTVTQAVCSSELPIVWNGKTFNTAGTQMATLTAANGCDSIVTMVLTVNTPVNTATTVSECGSYTWAANGQTYTTSGEYTYSHQDANGCTQVDTLHLTINNATSSEFTIETADSCYTWNGQTYCASGDYVQTLQTVNGCDSVVTLHLTTRVGVTVHEVEKVFLAPNPTKHICRIMGLETEPVSVDLYDMRGKLVMKASDREFDVTMLPTGLYMVKIYTGDRFINLKLVKQ